MTSLPNVHYAFFIYFENNVYEWIISNLFYFFYYPIIL